MGDNERNDAVLKKNPACAAFCACYKNSRQSPVVSTSLPLQRASPTQNNTSKFTGIVVNFENMSLFVQFPQ